MEKTHLGNRVSVTMDKERQKEMSRVGLSVWYSAVGHKEQITASRRHTAILDVLSRSHLEGSEREREWENGLFLVRHLT